MTHGRRAQNVRSSKRRCKQQSRKGNKPSKSPQVKADQRSMRQQVWTAAGCGMRRLQGAFQRTDEILQEAGQRTLFIIKKLSSLATDVRNGAMMFSRMDRWSVLDHLWDLTTVALSFIDIVCDISVLFQFYSKGYYGLFKTGCFIFVIAQVSYAFVFVCIYPPRQNTPHARIKLFFKILPVAQLVPFFIWLQSFQIPAIDKCLQWINVEVPSPHTTSTDSHKTCEYIRMKFEKHAGFIGEAFSEAIPQCLLQTAAICMYPELASPLSIYSILTSISVVASKGYLFSFAAHVPTRVFNLLCIIADLLNVFATATWLFAGSGNVRDYVSIDGWHQPFLLDCFMRAAQHGCQGAVAGFLCLVSKEVWCDRKRNRKSEDPWQIFFVFMQLLLLLLPGVVLLATLKLSLVPFLFLSSFSALDSENDAFFAFYERLGKLLRSSLPRAERERRICLVNVFCVFAEARLQDSFPTRRRDLPGVYLEDTCKYMFQRKFKLQGDQYAGLLTIGTKVEPVLRLLEPAASGTLALRAECQRQEASWLQLVRGLVTEWFMDLWADDTSARAKVGLVADKVAQHTQEHHAWRSTPPGRHIAQQFREFCTDDLQDVPEEVDSLLLSIKQDVSLVFGALYHCGINFRALAIHFCNACLHRARKVFDLAIRLYKKCYNAVRGAVKVGNRFDSFLLIFGAASGAYFVPQLLFFTGYTLLFLGQGMLYPTFQLLLRLWHADGGNVDDVPHGIQTLQMVLSTGFSLCLIMLVALLPLILRQDNDMIFYLRPGRLPGNFFCSATADAMAKACAADANSLQIHSSLLLKGLPAGVTSEVMAFVGPNHRGRATK